MWGSKCRDADEPFKLVFTISGPSQIPGSARLPKVPRPVCKQIWNETTSIFFSSAVFQFRNPEHFHAFALSISLQSVVPRIRTIKVISCIFSFRTFGKDWSGTFNTSIVGKFASLEGLIWKISMSTFNYQLLHVTDIAGDRRCQILKLPTMLRAFQQHRLRDNLTSVSFEYYNHPLPVPKTTALGSAMRGYLLTYVPRRTSRRGKREEM